jgi:hypothetical protein
VDLTGMLAETHWEPHRPATFGASYRILDFEAEACLLRRGSAGAERKI